MDAVATTARPKDLMFQENVQEASFTESSTNKPNYQNAQLELIISPVPSELSTSSVNERQRKLSETVFDWVFDESDSFKMSDLSEGTSSTVDDGDNLVDILVSVILD